MTPTQIATKKAIAEGKEVCLCAAHHFNGKIWLGHRHSYSMEAMHDELSYTMSRKEMMEAKTDIDSGFLTNFGRYVDREEGFRLQMEANIPSAAIQYGDNYRNGLLFSEDLY